MVVIRVELAQSGSKGTGFPFDVVLPTRLDSIGHSNIIRFLETPMKNHTNEEVSRICSFMGYRDGVRLA